MSAMWGRTGAVRLAWNRPQDESSAGSGLAAATGPTIDLHIDYLLHEPQVGSASEATLGMMMVETYHHRKSKKNENTALTLAWSI